jgi:hypothetical protein
LVPYKEDQSVNEHDRKVEYGLSIQQLSAGDWFPSIETLGSNRDILKYEGHSMLEKEIFIKHYGKGLVGLKSNVVTTSKCIIASIRVPLTP